MTGEPPKPTSMKLEKAWIKRKTRDPSPIHHRTRLTYEHLSDKRDRDIIKNRKDTVVLARLRAGHCEKLAAHKNLMDLTADPTCLLCRENSQTNEHWILECPGTVAARQYIFGTTDVGLNILTSDPKGAVELARRTL